MVRVVYSLDAVLVVCGGEDCETVYAYVCTFEFVSKLPKYPFVLFRLRIR